jgi:phosphopantetheinyl transferase
LNFDWSKVVLKFQFMPIFFQQDVDADTRLAVWKIEEEEDFFRASVSLHRAITHPHKRLQHLAGRYLLKFLFPDFPLEMIQLADTRKPFLEDEQFHFSISHSGNYAAAIVSKMKRVGIDIETISHKAGLISHKFLSPRDQKILSGNPVITGDYALVDSRNNELQTLLWSCKESVFKWEGNGGMDFREHMQLVSMTESEGHIETVILLKKQEEIFLNIFSYLFNEICLSHLST